LLCNWQHFLISCRQLNRMPENSNIVLPTEYFATGVTLHAHSDVSQEMTAPMTGCNATRIKSVVVGVFTCG